MKAWIAMTCLALAATPFGASAQQPKRGGTLTFAIAGEPPNYDCHAQYSFAALQWLSPHYSTLLKIDAARYPAIVNDVAASYEVSPDRLVYTFKLRRNVKFHDGTPMTSEDVKATYERIRKPPAGVVSLRSGAFEDVAAIETPDAHTVIFRMAKPDAGMLGNFASPWNCIYPAAKISRDPGFPKTNVLGTGPFVFVEHQRGSHWVGRRFDGYFEEGRPYLDGFRAIFMSGTATINALQGGQIMAEFRGFSPPDKERLVQAMGKDATVQESSWLCKLDLVFNTSKPPFNDPRVRRALSLAIDRWGGSKNLQRIALVKDVGGVMRPGYEFAIGKSDLVRYPGFGENPAAARQEAQRLLKEAGADKISFKLLNRTIAMPYTSVGLFMIDQWRQIGIDVSHQQVETAAYNASLQSGNYDASLSAVCDYMDDPSIQLLNYISKDRSSLNYGGYVDRKLDDLYERQKRAGDKQERVRLIREFEHQLYTEAYAVPVVWWNRVIVHHAQLKNWHVTPSAYLGQQFIDVWLDR